MNKDETGAVSTANALKMAIEALQNNQTYDWKGNPLTALDEANEKVINACKEALASYSEALESQEIGDAEIRQMLNDIEYYQKRVEELEQSAQPLSDDEIFKIVSTIEQIKPQYGMMLSNEWNILDFARAIEQALKEKNT